VWPRRTRSGAAGIGRLGRWRAGARGCSRGWRGRRRGRRCRGLARCVLGCVRYQCIECGDGSSGKRTILSDGPFGKCRVRFVGKGNVRSNQRSYPGILHLFSALLCSALLLMFSLIVVVRLVFVHRSTTTALVVRASLVKSYGDDRGKSARGTHMFYLRTLCSSAC
jgi:hypothetical protein